MKFPIYMDNHATTPVDPRVLEEMMPCFTSEFGNAASRNHPFGWHAKSLVDHAREQVASLISAESDEIIFTSGATESNNLAILGAMDVYREKGDHLITQVTEHKAVLDTAKYLHRNGTHVSYLHVDATGKINLENLKKATTDKTVLISIMYANHEIGTIQPIREIGRWAKERGILFHVDVAQALGKIPIDVQDLGIDLLSISAHKIYGPKGIGALYVRKKNPHVRLNPISFGGGQENGLRSGTLNVPGIVGLGKACELARQEMPEESANILALRDRLKEGIEKSLDHVYLNGHPTDRLPNNLNMSFAYVDGEALLTTINEEIAVSAGSACTTGSPEPSYILKSIGLKEELAHTAVRFGLGRFNTEEEVDYTIHRVVTIVRRLRDVSPIYQARKGA